jgi:iron complex outermembrane receptor protein
VGIKKKSLCNQDNSIIQLFPDTTTLEEIVVVGYGTSSRKDVTGP